MLWIIWKMAAGREEVETVINKLSSRIYEAHEKRNLILPDPHTTKMKRARSQGPTGYLSSWGFCNKSYQVF